MSTSSVSAEERKPASPSIIATDSVWLNDLLPCTKDDAFKAYSLKAEDGKNIQVTIICQRGRLKAYFPHEPLKKPEK